jgi:hypothetical protein
MNIICEYVASVTLLITLGNLLFGFCPVLLTIRRGSERMGRRSREIHTGRDTFFLMISS